MSGKSNDNLIYGIGHSSNINPITFEGKKVKEYETWRGMLKRCCDEEYISREPTYNGCTVSSEWLYYDNFYKWVTTQKNYQNYKTNVKNTENDNQNRRSPCFLMCAYLAIGLRSSSTVTSKIFAKTASSMSVTNLSPLSMR